MEISVFAQSHKVFPAISDCVDLATDSFLVKKSATSVVGTVT